jgi:hypothetical protein
MKSFNQYLQQAGNKVNQYLGQAGNRGSSQAGNRDAEIDALLRDDPKERSSVDAKIATERRVLNTLIDLNQKCLAAIEEISKIDNSWADLKGPYITNINNYKVSIRRIS